METLIARVAAATDATPDAARKAVALVLDFITREARTTPSISCSPRRRR